MEHLGHGRNDPSPQPQLQESRRSGIRGLLTKAVSWIPIGGREMIGNDQLDGGASPVENEASVSEAPTVIMSPAEREVAERKRMVAQAVKAADRKMCERERYQAGGDHPNSPGPRGLVIGPQKYTDPDRWRPPYHLYPEDSPERLAFEAGHPIPLTQDRVLGRALDLVIRLDHDLGL